MLCGTGKEPILSRVLSGRFGKRWPRNLIRVAQVVPGLFADATMWHSWAVEWTPDRIAVYLDGVRWAVTTDTSRFPPRPMHLCLQLDNFGGETAPGGKMFVDWVAEYPV
ncbi:Glycosyl hydrolases family 16 [Gordonia rubripertincta]|nr:Glycosyl hydrolases family 16 [Gordonia rubripertincta]